MERLRDDPKVEEVRVLSPLTDESEHGISALSYGMSMATGKLIEVGEAVGVIAGAVNRRARHAADHAYLPHRWPWSART